MHICKKKCKKSFFICLFVDNFLSLCKQKLIIE